ncbi:MULTISPECIES: histidine phosphatase family protein [Thermomonosporaceae]|uniref:histidine phosphatase family protein n=1 Tax=Thermomonosporaceae TaxID=2012 RepID=UPI00255AE1EC|nr:MULTISPECIES: histidine phosphatase family protein [Thermomonosporaceae]MDL4775836.1 histidine phosphatase family protein [Actinomadura xylanilytica]
MTRLVLVRHGESEWHRENRYAGVSDVGLTARGVAQAGRLAVWAAAAGLDAVWSSTLGRARVTGRACADATGLELRSDERLRELDFGVGEGLTVGEMDPGVLEAFRRDPVRDHFPGGEDPAAAVKRFTACLDDIAAAHRDGRVLVVAHTTVIRLSLCHLMGVPLSEYRRLFPSLGNCAISEIALRPGQVSVLEFNTPLDHAASALETS